MSNIKTSSVQKYNFYDSVDKKALKILKETYGATAEFHEGQLEAIESVVDNPKTLVIQKTGWGKSLVYFIATKIMKENNFGPTIIVSPLISLMENQKTAAEKFQLNVVIINSKTKFHPNNWGKYDVVIITPEQLANRNTRKNLMIGKHLFVVDEIHSVSEMGEGFRPDYQRVFDVINNNDKIKFLGTTATANNRFIEYLEKNIGSNINVLKGDLFRNNISIQVNKSQSISERLSWIVKLIKNSKRLKSKQGIIYCLTARECNLVNSYLKHNDIESAVYHSKSNQVDDNLEEFEAGITKVLVATDKIGMGYDNFNIDFIIHFQIPKNLTTYYQQIGRAGRDKQHSYAILLHDKDDMEISKFFIDEEHVNPKVLKKICEICKNGISKDDIYKRINISNEKIEQALKYLDINDYIYGYYGSNKNLFYKESNKYKFDISKEEERQSNLKLIRKKENDEVYKYIYTKKCYMEFLVSEFNGQDSNKKCNICTNCLDQMIFKNYLTPIEIDTASAFLNNKNGIINPRTKYSSGLSIDKKLQMQQGFVLYDYYFSDGGKKVHDGKYIYDNFSNELVLESQKILENEIKKFDINLVVPVPSLRRKELVPNFAKRLASGFNISFSESVEKVEIGHEQKKQENSIKREENIRKTIKINSDKIIGENILLVDDMVDSRWSLTIIAEELLKAGANKVYPFALVKTGSDN